MKHGTIIFPALLTVMLCGAAHAGQAPLDLQTASGTDQFVQIREELGSEKYAEISSDDRRTVLGLLDRMEVSVQRTGGIDSMPEQQKVDLFNNQEKVNAILTQAAEDSRMVCRREQTTGSHRKTTVCLTAGERRRIRESTQDQLRTMPRQHVDRGGF